MQESQVLLALCNCKGKPLFDWLNAMIMELLKNHVPIYLFIFYQDSSFLLPSISVFQYLSGEKNVSPTKVMDGEA